MFLKLFEENCCWVRKFTASLGLELRTSCLQNEWLLTKLLGYTSHSVLQSHGHILCLLFTFPDITPLAQKKCCKSKLQLKSLQKSQTNIFKVKVPNGKNDSQTYCYIYTCIKTLIGMSVKTLLSYLKAKKKTVQLCWHLISLCSCAQDPNKPYF